MNCFILCNSVHMCCPLDRKLNLFWWLNMMRQWKVVKILVLHRFIFSYEMFWMQEMAAMKHMALPSVVDMNWQLLFQLVKCSIILGLQVMPLDINYLIYVCVLRVLLHLDNDTMLVFSVFLSILKNEDSQGRIIEQCCTGKWSTLNYNLDPWDSPTP